MTANKVLLLLAPLDRGRPLEREPVDLVTVVLDAVGSAGAVEPEPPIRIDTGEGPVEVRGDRNRLRPTFGFHTPPGTPASVRVSADGDRVTVAVADDGPGMTADEAAHAFDRFWQAGADATSTGRGTGLGQSIVAGIVAAHDGDIRLDTARGEGTAFTITLPRSGAPVEDSGRPAARTTR